MHVELLRGLGDPIVLEGVTRVLVLGDDGVTPLSVASEVAGGVTVAHGGEGRFAQVLRMLGITRTVIATPISVQPRALDTIA